MQEDLTKLSDFEKQVYNAMNFDQKTTLDVNANCEKKQTRINMLPVGCGVSYNDIPCNCYYSNATDTRGDCFVIDRHPFLVKQGLRQWSTTQARNKSTMQKFDLLKEKLKTLEDLSKENKIEVHVKQVRDNSLPKDCGMEASMLPKHCYFLHGSVKRGGKFVIDKHPKLVATGIKFWSTTGSINVSIEDKVFQFKAKLQELGITLMT